MSTEGKRERYEGQEYDDGSVLAALARLEEVDELPDEPFLDRVINRARRRPVGQLTKHFNLREFYCKDGTRPKPGRWRTYKALCRQYLEPMRAKFGPCTVNSGYRTRSWNAKVGGEPGSYHVNELHDVDDVAADVRFERGDPAQWASYANTLRAKNRDHKGGIGRYPRQGFVHVDTRDYQANWSG